MKITSSELQRNDFASMAFYRMANYAVKSIRVDIEHYKTLDKINTAIFGEIRALSLLCEHFDGGDNPIMTEEANDWKTVLLDYCERNKRKIPKDLRDDFLKNLTADLDKIIAHSNNIPDFLWKDDAQKRDIVVSVQNQELKDKYNQLAENKYSKLGGALQNYLLECLEKLDENAPQTEQEPSLPDETAFRPQLFASQGEFTLLVTDFQVFLSEKEQKNDTEINAYDLEKRIKKHLKETDKSLLKTLDFDCESSLFSVRSKQLENVLSVHNTLMQWALCDNKS
ncbi:hypothetical protein [Capnocytophaga sp.]|uniref:hypothetical protein n=1 Tax=Capnocytophaga sp. TaxID=44737 RepID=UPI0026DD483B|nr:hypothetical protein [Capnocytophaga sp.]MDO5106143.1 hypothetical protein [Capnocytophaga sp.]